MASTSTEIENSYLVNGGKNRLNKLLIITIILLPTSAAIICMRVFVKADQLPHEDWMLVSAAILLSLFLPLLAYSYFFFRQERREKEIDRIFNRLRLRKESEYLQMFKSVRCGPYFFLAAGIAWVITLAGLLFLFFGDDYFFSNGNKEFPIAGSSRVFGMAFLGAYFWGLIYVLRRYVSNDVIPGVFYGLSIRMLFASSLAVLIFNGYETLTGQVENNSSMPDAKLWPVFAFLIGAFPQRGLEWLTERVPFFSNKSDPSVRPLPLETIEGIATYDRMRLEELGIESCHDLAPADFVPILLKSSYGARQIKDWILQAKLCVYCGPSIKDLRQNGVRTILDLADLNDKQILHLARTTSANEFSLRRAQEYAMKDPEIERLQSVAERLSQYTDHRPNPKPKTK